jgi:hypothetical protein
MNPTVERLMEMSKTERASLKRRVLALFRRAELKAVRGNGHRVNTTLDGKSKRTAQVVALESYLRKSCEALLEIEERSHDQ